MAQFYASIEGQRGPASRLGSARSGIRSHTRGWNVGVEVSGKVEDGEDVFYVYATGGSNGRVPSRLIAKLTASTLTHQGMPGVYDGETA